MKRNSTINVKPPLGPIIKERVERVGMAKAELARRLYMSPANVHKIFKRETMDIRLLQRISDLLEFDFVAWYNDSPPNKRFQPTPKIQSSGEVLYSYATARRVRSGHHKLGFAIKVDILDLRDENPDEVSEPLPVYGSPVQRLDRQQLLKLPIYDDK